MRGIALFFRAIMQDRIVMLPLRSMLLITVKDLVGIGNRKVHRCHTYVLDLALFPKMSRNHCELVRKVGGTKVLQEDESWNGAQAVWHTMPSCDIARSFVLSYRTAKKIVEVKGDNYFLSGKKGGLHANVRKDFMDTETGIV